MGIKAKIAGVITALGLGAGALIGQGDAQPSGDDIVSCGMNGDGAGEIVQADGDVTTIQGAWEHDGQLLSSNGGSVAPTVLCDVTEDEPVQTNNDTPEIPLSDSYICAADEYGNVTDVIIAETGEEDMQVSARFLEQATPSALEGTIGSCLLDGPDGESIAPAVPSSRINEFKP